MLGVIFMRTECPSSDLNRLAKTNRTTKTRPLMKSVLPELSLFTSGAYISVVSIGETVELSFQNVCSTLLHLPFSAPDPSVDRQNVPVQNVVGTIFSSLCFAKRFTMKRRHPPLLLFRHLDSTPQENLCF